MKRTAFVLEILFVAVLLYIAGCAPPPPAAEEKAPLSPEQQKALSDSLWNAHLTELKIIRSLAYEHYKNKSWANAAKYYEELVRKDTTHQFSDYGNLAHCYVELGVAVDSVKMVYQDGLTAFPDDAYLHASLGHIFRTQGLLDSALVHYQAAVQYKPEELEYKKTLAELYTRVNRPLDAIALYKEVLEVEPDNKDIRQIYDDLVRRNRPQEEYIKSLEETVAKFPDDLDKKIELAKAYTDVGRNEEALNLLKSVTAKAPDNTRALEALAVVYQNMSNYSGAVDAYSRILKFEPDNTRIMVEVSNSYRQLGEFAQARNFARKAANQDSKFGAAYVAMASAYETAADEKTAGKPPGYKDKLVYLIAYGLYQDAKNSGDFRVLVEAENRLKYLKESQLIPVYADWFMHQTEKDPTEGGGYSWIQSNWPELNFIQTYLDKISQK